MGSLGAGGKSNTRRGRVWELASSSQVGGGIGNVWGLGCSILGEFSNVCLNFPSLAMGRGFQAWVFLPPAWAPPKSQGECLSGKAGQPPAATEQVATGNSPFSKFKPGAALGKDKVRAVPNQVQVRGQVSRGRRGSLWWGGNACPWGRGMGKGGQLHNGVCGVISTSCRSGEGLR